jgi:hypothetical protein
VRWWEWAARCVGRQTRKHACAQGRRLRLFAHGGGCPWSACLLPGSLSLAWPFARNGALSVLRPLCRAELGAAAKGADPTLPHRVRRQPPPAARSDGGGAEAPRWQNGNGVAADRCGMRILFMVIEYGMEFLFLSPRTPAPLLLPLLPRTPGILGALGLGSAFECTCIALAWADGSRRPRCRGRAPVVGPLHGSFRVWV